MELREEDRVSDVDKDSLKRSMSRDEGIYDKQRMCADKA